MSVITATIGLNVNIVDTLAVSAGRLTSYVVPVQLSVSTSYADGTAANQANRVYQFSGSAAGAPVSIDLSTVVCADGTTGFTKVRELIIFNDATNAAYTLAFGNDGVGTNLFIPMLAGTTPQVAIEPSFPQRFGKPIGTTGWTVDSTHKNIRLDPGVNTVAYRVVVLGN